MKLNVKALGLTSALMWGFGIFFITWWIIYFDGQTGETPLLRFEFPQGLGRIDEQVPGSQHGGGASENPGPEDGIVGLPNVDGVGARNIQYRAIRREGDRLLSTHMAGDFDRGFA